MNAKRITSLLLALIMALSAVSLFVTAADNFQFTDVTSADWAYESIKYVTDEGLMNGTGGGVFTPKANLTRAMVITVLYRMEGSPDVNFKVTDYLDVPYGQFYSDATAWAYKNGIITGTSTDEWGIPMISPSRDITRQELATMFVRYANFKHVKMENEGSLDRFEDRDRVASWASDAMKWATSVGLINGTGTGTTLSPTGNATREQFATIIHRYCTTEFDYNLFYGEPMPLHSYTEPEYPLVSDADFYVAVDGSDSNPGTLAKPFATFEKARDAVRELKKTKKTAIKVAFKAGNYGSLDNITFTAEDGGNESAPITYCKYGDGDVVFTNGIKIPASSFKPVDESDLYLLGSVDTSKIYKADLKGIVDKLERTNILFAEDKLCHEARIPNKTSSGSDNYYFDLTTVYNEKESILVQNQLVKVIEGLRTTEGMKVSGFLRYGWLTDTFPVKSYDPATKVLTFDFENHDFHNGYPIDDVVLAYEDRFDDQIFLHNLSDQIDADGEYWFDPDTKILYVYKAKGDYHISTGGTFMYIAPGAEYLTFLGLDFSTSSANGIEIAADHLTFDRCSVSNIGGSNAIVTVFRDGNEPGTRWSTFKGCEFFNFVDTGLNIEASYQQCYQSLVPSGNVIENNYFHDFGDPAYRSQAIATRWEVGMRIANNEFKNGSRAAIMYQDSVDLVIEYNVFENMMCSGMDYGVIYSYRQITNRGNQIRYNLFKNTRFYTWVYSIYVDGSWGQEFIGNIFYDSATLAVLLNGGRDNIVKDNIVISQGNNRSIVVSNWNFDETTGTLEAQDVIENSINSLPKPGEENYQKWYDRWPTMYNYSFDVSDKGKPECIFTALNHMWNNHGFGNVNLNNEVIEEQGDLKDNELHKLTEDVGFVCPAIGDYRVTSGAKVPDIHFEKIGRY